MLTELDESIKLPWGTAVQIRKLDNAYMYRVIGPDFPPVYEVFERRAVAVCIDFENRVYSQTDKKEIYPKSNDFGKWAYSYNSYDAAIFGLNSLNDRKQNVNTRTERL